MEGEKTVLVKAQSKSTSLRTTVPMSVVKQLGLKEGSHLVWKMEARRSRLVVCVIGEK